MFSKSEKSILLSTLGFFFKFILLGAILRIAATSTIIYQSLSNSTSSFQEILTAITFGFRFDFAAAALFYLIYFTASRVLQIRASITQTLLTLLLAAYIIFWGIDTSYVVETGRHISYELYTLATFTDSFINLLIANAFKILIALVAAFYISKFFKPYTPANSGYFKKSYNLLFILVFTLVAFRGTASIPQDVSWSYKAGTSIVAPVIALNGVYSLIWGALAGKRSIFVELNHASINDSKEIYTAFLKSRAVVNPQGNSTPNIVWVFLESWPGFNVNALEDGKPITPFFNELSKESLTTELFLAGGHRTTEGMFSSLCSRLNPRGKSIMYSEIESKNFECFPDLLRRQKKYSTAFFQGSDQLTSGVGLMAQKIGFTDSYGRIEMPAHLVVEQNNWGVYDRELYAFSLEKLQAMREPLLIGINTNTTHDVMLPQQAKDAGFKSAWSYADSELESFYTDLKKHFKDKEWLFVLVADHTAYGGPDLLKHYSVPMLIKIHSKDPKKLAFNGQKKSGAYHQIDLAPTLADLIGIQYSEFEGRSLLQNSPDGSGIYHNGFSVWFYKDRALVIPQEIPTSFQCYTWVTDPDFKSPTPCNESDHQAFRTGWSYIVESQIHLFGK